MEHTAKQAKKKEYKGPKLNRLGNMAKITKAKLGNKSDGAGKPATRNSGGNT